jgi:hypothetical protein
MKVLVFLIYPVDRYFGHLTDVMLRLSVKRLISRHKWMSVSNIICAKRILIMIICYQNLLCNAWGWNGQRSAENVKRGGA